MPVRFEQFRVSLMIRPQKELFSGPDLDPEKYLRSVFLQPHRFEYRGIAFQYLPNTARSDRYIFGGIGRERSATEDVPTAQGFQEGTHVGWKAAFFALDPVNAEDGQKAAVEVDNKVGSPASLITALVGRINEENPDAPYNVEVQPIFDGQSFWQFAQEHRGQITELTFDMVVPNGLWNSAKTVKEEMQEAKERLKAQRVVNTIKSKDGINTDDERIKDAVDYAESGSAAIRAKTRTGRRYNSKNKTRTAVLDDEAGEGTALIVRAEFHIQRVLDRE